MKLLIVDDEALTRTGVIASLDWKELGVDEILEADDGVHGLETALRHRPEIILCDVRMPRMDGIAMLEKLEETLPDTVAIFMSGYSDKEYLKAAIRLKAVNYIEKPLNPREIREAFLAAKELYFQKQQSHRGRTLHSKATAYRLARQLATPYGANGDEIARLAGELSLTLGPGTVFTTFIVKPDFAREPSDTDQEEIAARLEAFLKRDGMKCLSTEKHRQYLVYFILSDSRPTQRTLQSIGAFLGECCAGFGRFMIAAGSTASGVAHAYASYASAVVVLQSCFFFPAGSCLYPEQDAGPDASRAPLPDSFRAQFLECLTGRDRAGCDALLAQLLAHFSRNRTVFENQVKDFYYKLMLSLEDARSQLLLAGRPEAGGIVELLESCFSFEELHGILVDRVGLFFDDLAQSVQENSTIFLIKEFISRNYMNELLSVRDIGAHVFLSASYVCTFFKNETGQTLNQYLTQYRMERAKQLLSDPRYRIADVSSKVGYSDSNYFGKSFKKYCGLSPSEYRENALP